MNKNPSAPHAVSSAPVGGATGGRRRPSVLVAVVTAAASSAVGLFAYEGARFRSERNALRDEVTRGRYALARPGLIRLASRRPDDGETRYVLGVCEAGLGHEREALGAWSAVPDGSAFSGRAAVMRARRELARHRLSSAEELMPRALGDEGPHAREAVETLVNLYKIEGRYDEALGLVRKAADRYPDRIGLLKEMAQLGSINPHKLGRVREGLDTAGRASPDDDRVWLGRANLATRTGEFADASRWLERCEARRPDDPAVGRARLKLAVESGDVAGVWRALARLPAGSLDAPAVLTLRAWLAARAADESAERAALRDLLAVAPASLPSLERLAELELKAGLAEESARLRVRKAELDRAKAQYEIVLFLPDAHLRSAQLARYAEALGRRQEARILWTLAVKQRPGDPEPTSALIRLDHAPTPRAPDGATVTALLADRARLDRPGPSDRAPADRLAVTPPSFVDDAGATGLKFTFDNGLDPVRHLPETMSGGLALIDYDGDGRLDVYCVQGGPFVADPARRTGGDRLFRNRPDGTFEDVSARSGIDAMPRGYGHGVTVGDFDNDGHPDLFLTRWRAYALYRNRGDGTFEDVTARVGLGGDRDWPTSAAFADLDNDGDLDLYVCHYLKWDAENPQVCIDPKKNAPVFCGPPRFKSVPDHLFRNDSGTFVDVTAEAGIVDTHGMGLGVVACDLDQDGRVDLFVSNDQSANFLFRNLGGLKFEEVAESAGVGSSADGTYKANMGVACGDPDGDGLPDLAVTEFYNEGTSFFQNLGAGIFADHSAAAGLLVATRYTLGFGLAFFDYDADGRLDLAIANGHVDDFRPAEPYMMPAQLLAGTRPGKFVDVSPRAGPPWQVPRVGRGLVSGDLDNDGRVDLVVLSQNQPLAYFHNKTASGHWLTLRLEGTKSNRDAVGARVTVTTDRGRQTSWRVGGGSYQSSGDPRLHFGLGPAARLTRVEVVWPSGRVDRHEGLGVDAGYWLREGEERARPIPTVRR